MAKNLVIQLEDGVLIELESSCYCVFIDETGSESLRDPNYPIFGMGGCGTLVSHYWEWLALPWTRMKSLYFGDPNIALHASDIRPGISRFGQKVKGLNEFFGCGPYSRFAAIYEINTEIGADLPDLHTLAIEVLRSQIYKVVAPWEPSRIAVIFESCERSNHAVANQFMTVKSATASHPDGRSYEIPIDTFFARKDAKLEGVEVADFIINTAGTTYRDVLAKGIKPKDRKDFLMTFGDRHDERLVDVRFTQRIETK